MRFLMPMDYFRAAFLLPVFLTGGLIRGTRGWVRASFNQKPETEE